MTEQGPRDAVPGERRPPTEDPVDGSATSEPLDLDEGTDVVIAQENVGPGSELGGGEFPDPHTPPSDAAAGDDGVVAERKARTGDPDPNAPYEQLP
jgi:hypothetical protein